MMIKAATERLNNLGAGMEPARNRQMTAHTVELDRGGDPSRLGEIATRLSGRWKLGLRAEITRYGLLRDLAHNFQAPGAKIPLAVRPLADRDLPALFGHAGAASELAERLEVAWRRAFIEKIGGFPPLADGEALLENAYTPPAYRGLGVMAAAMAQIAERARDFGARKVLTFVATDNIASLKGCQRAGFYPHLLHRRTRFGFGLITRDRFETLPEGDPRRSVKF